MLLYLLLLVHSVRTDRLETPDFWGDEECIAKPSMFEKGPKPRPYGTYGDEFDPKSPNYFFQNGKKRRVYYGITNTDNDFPFTSICNIMEKSFKYHWCTCIIIAAEYALTNRLCFRDRPHNSHPKAKLPPIMITLGTTRKTTHNITRDVMEIHNHPNPNIDACLLRFSQPISFHNRLQPLSPEIWIKTTGWRNIIPKCSTFMCGYGGTEIRDTDFLQCVFYGFTTNIVTMTAGTGLQFTKVMRNYTRAWLGSVNDHEAKFKRWVDDETIGGHYSTSCTGDAGAPLFYWDERGEGIMYLIGMNTGTKNSNSCGIFGVDMAVSLIALVGWLSKFVEPFQHPLMMNPFKERKWVLDPNR